MVVTDSLLFPPPTMIKVRVTNMNGAQMVIDANLTWKCHKLKLSLEPLLVPAAGQGGDVASSSDTQKNSLMNKLILLRTGETLNDEGTLQQQGVKNNDELLLLKRRPIVPVMETDKQREEKKAPDIAMIRKATENLTKKHHDCPLEEASSSLDFQSELRRILISLIEASQRILCLNPEAAKIFKQAEDMLNEAPARKTSLEESAVKQLTDMGFPQDRARKALLLNQQSVMSAMEWLLNHESDPDIDKPLPGMNQSDETDEEEKSEEQPQPNMADSQAETEGAEEGAVGGNHQPRFKNILETIRAFQRREFRPNPRALQSLIEMGFSEKDAIYALRLSRNNQDSACDWLLGDRKERAESADTGLDINSPVYKAIIGHPSVQLGLNSPRCLLAFLQMLENPVRASHWLNDPETGPLLMQISRIYHSEKLTPFGPQKADGNKPES